MRLITLFLVFMVSAFANYPNQVSVLLDLGANDITVINSGAGGSNLPMQFAPQGGQRIRFTISPIYVPPPSGTTYTSCAAPCSISINRNWGQQYYWVEYVDSSGNPLNPRKDSQAGGAYRTNSVNGLGTLPQVELPIVTTSPFPMPVVVVGQDAYVTRVRLPLVSGHASSGLRLYLRIHNPGYTNTARPDGKIDIQINSAAWLHLTNADATGIDEMRYYGGIGSYARVREFTLPVVDGTIGSGDSSVDIGFRMNAAEGNTSGARILSVNLIEASKMLSTITIASNVARGTASGVTGYAVNDTLLIQNAPGMYMRANGLRVVTSIPTGASFTFAPCGTSTPGCTSPDIGAGDLRAKPPVNRNPATIGIGVLLNQQAVMYAARCIIAKSAFTETDPTTWTAPAGSDPARGEKLFKFGNAAGTVADNQLVDPVFAAVDYKFTKATCGGARGCHPSQGMDLKIYNFDNHSIKQRSIYHGFTDQDGDDVAAYIRTLNTPVPRLGRPWNPPMQPGPGLSKPDARKAAGAPLTLTQIVVASSVGTATFSANPGLVIGSVITVYGATVDTDLNNAYAVTAIGTNTASFTTNNVANGTYTESTLGISNPIDFMAGAGLDAVLTYGYADFDEYLSPGGDRSKWPWDQHVEVRDLPSMYQLPDWEQWLPICHPADCFPAMNFLSTTDFSNYQDIIDNMTTNDFSSFQSHGYGGIYTNFSAGGGSLNLAGNPAALLAAQDPPSIWPMARFSIQQYADTKMWEIAIEKQTFQFDRLRQTALHGAPANASWYIANGIGDFGLFNTGMHRLNMRLGLYDIAGDSTQACTYSYQSNIWYTAQEIFGANNGWDSPLQPLDNAYYNAFLKGIAFDCRPNGYMNFFASLTSPQAGNARPEFYRHLTSPSTDGTDWTAMWAVTWVADIRFSLLWFTDAEKTALANSYLDMLNAITSAHTADYWSDTLTHDFNQNSESSCMPLNSTFGSSNGNACASTGIMLALFRAWGADSTKLTTFRDWAKTLTTSGRAWTGHDFDADYAAGVEGDTGDYGTGDLSNAIGLKTITFTSCPVSANNYTRELVIGGGTGTAEIIAGINFAGGTCVKGSPGTLIFNITNAHTGAWKATYGCSTVNPYPNYDFQIVGETPTWRCSNM